MEDEELKEYGVTVRVIQYYQVTAVDEEDAKESIRCYDGRLVETEIEEFVEVFPI